MGLSNFSKLTSCFKECTVCPTGEKTEPASRGTSLCVGLSATPGCGFVRAIANGENFEVARIAAEMDDVKTLLVPSTHSLVLSKIIMIKCSKRWQISSRRVRT